MPLRQPAVWATVLALSLLLLGLLAIALPNSASGPVIWTWVADYGFRDGLRLADAVGLIMLGVGSVLIWIMGLIRQWRYTH